MDHNFRAGFEKTSGLKDFAFSLPAAGAVGGMVGGGIGYRSAGGVLGGGAIGALMGAGAHLIKKHLKEKREKEQQKWQDSYAAAGLDEQGLSPRDHLFNRNVEHLNSTVGQNHPDYQKHYDTLVGKYQYDLGGPLEEPPSINKAAALSTSLIGAGLGAATGGTIGALSSKKGDRLKHGLMGGAIGGLAGGIGGHMAPKHLMNSTEHLNAVANKIQGAGFKITPPSARKVGLL